ncbi:hypothetical protein D3C72_2246060 [compost metagenome]
MKDSPANCCADALPAEPKLSGWVLPIATRSCTVFAGLDCGTTSTRGTSANCVMGVKSLNAS